MCTSFKKGLEDKKAFVNRMLKEFSDRKVILWGAGTFCSNLFKIYELSTSNVNFIVDSDRKKWEKEFLDYPFKIKPPAILKKNPGACLIVCSMYAGQITERLLEMRHNGPIIKLHPKAILYRSDNNGKKNKN